MIINPERRILFITPQNKEPSGGNKQLYRMVDVLNTLNFQAYILHESKGFRFSWFHNKTHILYNGHIFKELNKLYAPLLKTNSIYHIYFYLRTLFKRLNWGKDIINTSDILVFPEFYGRFMNDILPNHKKVIYVQGCYLTFKHFNLQDNLKDSLYFEPNTLAIIVNSEDGRSYMEQLCTQLPIYITRHSVNTTLFAPAKKKKKIMAYMSRKYPEDSKQIINYLTLCGVLDDWELINIDKVNHEEVATVLNKSAVFLSTNTDEGFPLPSIEAMASGCLVIGYTGKGGREYFKEDFSIPIPEKEIQIFMQKALEEVSKLNQDFGIIDAISIKARAFIETHYNEDIEKEDIANIWSQLISVANKN